VRQFLLRRIGESALALFLATVVVFIGVHSLPGDPAVALSGEGRDPAAVEAVRARYGLDQPLPVQYVRWLGMAVRGNIGTSIRSHVSVSETILDRLPVTLELAALSLLTAIVIGIPVGILAAVRRGGALDYFGSVLSLFGLSLPTFWFGLVLILGLASYLHWLPASGFVPLLDNPVENLRRMVMPALVLGSGLGAVLMRQMRSAMLESLGSEYVRTARAKGLSEWEVVGIHALRNSLISIVTILGLELGALISGSVVTETIFLVPGFGRLIIDAVYSRDYPIIQGVAFYSAAAYIFVNLLVDLTYSILNPRIRVSRFAS
jgi:peptide/nickel transport system permease protein